jgi:hypothetical protein
LQSDLQLVKQLVKPQPGQQRARIARFQGSPPRLGIALTLKSYVDAAGAGSPPRLMT